jgi:hypothetical protein
MVLINRSHTQTTGFKLATDPDPFFTAETQSSQRVLFFFHLSLTSRRFQLWPGWDADK